MDNLRRILYVVFFITLLAFAGVQLNDPDAAYWVGFYTLLALIPLLLVFNRFYPPLFVVAVLWAVVELVHSGPGAYQFLLHMDRESLVQGMNPEKPYIEQCREFLGVFIALSLAVCSALLARSSITR